jgi:pimeloyl-ACP methyl ester carboxylesterase
MTMTETIRSADGTEIAYEVTGGGPPLILVDGALCFRAQGPGGPLAKELAKDFTVYTYDRRGRGESGNAAGYSPGLEIDDLAALIKRAGGSAAVAGISSGAVLALEAANSGLPITRLALYEAPFIVDDSREPAQPDLLAQVRRLVAQDRRADAVRLFMRTVGLPGFVVALMRFMPAWGTLKAVAHTLPYDLEFLDGLQAGRPLPEGRWNVEVPVLALDGGKSPAWMRASMAQLAARLPTAEYRTLPGQTHMVKAPVLAPVLAAFLGR